MTRNVTRMFLCALLLLTSCASSGTNTLLGLGVGEVVGGGVGLAFNPGPRGRYQAQNLGIGAAIGAVVGALAGLFLLPNNEKIAKPSVQEAPPIDPMANARTSGSSPGEPVLLPPKIDTKYIDDQVRGNVYVPGHLEYQIVEPSQWSKE